MVEFEVHKVFTQSGKSLAIVLPINYARKLGLKDGSHVRIFESGGQIIVEPIKPPESVPEEKAKVEVA